MDQPADHAPDPHPRPGTREPSLKTRVVESIENLFADNKDVLSFSELYAAESCHLERAPGGDATAESPPPPRPAAPHVRVGAAGEPAVSFTPHARFGLALSGGGIRSATFNLGLLQGLARLGVLPHVDYLATVSGGGYVGGFWTAWLHRRGHRPGPARFPLGNDTRGGERAEIRHLREFSRFLLPRVGVLQTEFWAIAMTILGGMMPSLLAALAVLALGWYLWIFGLAALAVPGWPAAALTSLALVFYLAVSEIKWRNAGRAERNPVETGAYATITLLSAAQLFALFAGLMGPSWERPDLFAWPSFSETQAVLALPALLGICTVTLLAARLVAARICRKPRSLPMITGLERCATRLLGITIGMTAIAALWLLAAFVADLPHQRGLTVTASGATVAAALFAWAKRWLTQPVQETRGSGLIRFLTDRLKRATPKALALLVWLLLVVLVGALLHRQGSHVGDVLAPAFWWPLAASLGVVALVAWLFDPARVGMHDFYRSRISRCYLGASNRDAASRTEAERAALNRHIAERPDDDLTLGQLREVSRPLHLVCVAANDMSGDPLGNLYRGARSAVLSGNGISLGNQTARLDELRLSSALTASAAAFNSQMGRVSMDLGPAVGFLMSALNLRLGLWVPHPANRFRGSYILPGRFFLAELLGISHTDAHNLHLSDGNHFENFGLYELVRRHCRYILVSDCGADPEVAFDDLANVLRRVREDFGVEIEIDIAPLRPDAHHRSRQHAVVGTIHYNGIAGLDKGTLLYIKPALTGDEPPDVLQYGTRNALFPHESTGDQFYDEAQWESYRRLGEHAVEQVLGFFEAGRFARGNVADRLFRDARSRWHPAPENHHARFLAMSERCAALEADLLNNGPAVLCAEFFAEASALEPKQEKPAAERPKCARGDLPDALHVMGFLIRVGQIMEDIWVGTELDRYWSHPLNEGWMNYFRRWAATPSFRRWWPVIASLYSIGLREFVGKRFKVGAVDPETPSGRRAGDRMARLSLREVDDAGNFFETAFVARQYLQTRPGPNLEGARVFAFDLRLLDETGGHASDTLPVGLALTRAQPVDPSNPDAGLIITWNADNLFVPDPLYGSGFVSKFLDALLRHLRADRAGGWVAARVQFGDTSTEARDSRAQTSPAATQERVREIEFYQSRGFTYLGPEDARTGAATLQISLR